MSIEQIREAIRGLRIVPFAEGGDREVRDRNREERARVVDAIRLDDVWQALDDLQARADLDAEIGR